MSTSIALQNVKNVHSLLNKMTGQIKAALPTHVPLESYVRAAITLTQKNPKLLECDQLSFLGALMEAAQKGLTLGSEAHLVPFRNNQRGILEVQFIADYKGLIKLIEQSGAVRTIKADVVRVDDHFEENDVLGITHKKKFEPGEKRAAGNVDYVLPKSKSPIWAVYAEAAMSAGGYQSVVMTMDEIEFARSKSKKPDGPWKDFFIEMAKKTAIRRLAKYIPQSPNLSRVMELEQLDDDQKSQGLRANVDSDYVPTFETIDATTIPKVNEQAAAASEADKKELVMTEVEKSVKKLTGSGWKDSEILLKLNLKSWDELKKEKLSIMETALEVLEVLEQRT